MSSKYTARKLRKSMTEAEIRLWQRIRRKQICNLQFYRQKQIGKYIVDFYCPKKKLIIEVDGGHHYLSGELVGGDLKREHYLKNVLKLRVLRFTNNDVISNIYSVIYEIEEAVSSPPLEKEEVEEDLKSK